MAWFDFSDLATVHFNMAPHAAFRFFLFVKGATVAGQTAKPTYTELFFSAYSPVPKTPKNVYNLLPVNKRERDHCLVWMPPNDQQRLITAKTATGENAARLLDVTRGKWYTVSKELDYLRQGNLNGVVGELSDNPPPLADLPAPPLP